jgi:hypothetical protein
MRHNQKNSNKILLVADKFVLKNLTPGPTLCFNCLGDMYSEIIENMHVIPEDVYNNLVLINNVEFKYKTVDELCDYITQVAAQYLATTGRIIFSFEHKYLMYDRVDVSVNSMLLSIANKLPHFRQLNFVNLLGKSPAGYGDYFFCFELI